MSSKLRIQPAFSFGNQRRGKWIGRRSDVNEFPA